MQAKKRAELVQVISYLVDSFSEKEKEELFAEVLGKSNDGLPISIFRSNLSGLEVISVYLRDVVEKEINEIAALLNRNRNTIYTTYTKAKKKLQGELITSDFSIAIPLAIFADRKYSILESLVAYLKDEHNLRFVRIAKLLEKSYSTVKTGYGRYQKKCR